MSTVEAVSPLRTRLQDRFDYYRCGNLVGIRSGEFQNQLESQIGMVDAANEGYRDEEIDRQRDLTLKYHWGHNHNFGDFQIPGRMRDRHLNLMVDFMENFPVDESTFAGIDVLDVGCWTGGTTLLLHSLGSRVIALEEVRKYADTVNFLASSFGIQEKVQCRAKSLFKCNDPIYHNRFDLVYFPGVIYHLSDPVLALRILYNSLRINGEILVEGAGIKSEEPICRFDGNYIYRNGSKEEMNRGGWNWFLPSASALQRMMHEAGFEEVSTFFNEENHRVYGYARKKQFVGICKAGLSVPGIL